MQHPVQFGSMVLSLVCEFNIRSLYSAKVFISKDIGSANVVISKERRFHGLVPQQPFATISASGLASQIPANARLNRRALEICAGSGCFSASMRLLCWYCYATDILYSRFHDITTCHFKLWFMDGLKQRAWRYVHIGCECTTWSVAANGKYRSKEFIWGKHFISRKRRHRTLAANRQARATFEFLAACDAHNVPSTLENPLSSLLWRVPACKRLLKTGRWWFVDTHYCQWGKRFKEPIRFFDKLHMADGTWRIGTCMHLHNKTW